MGLHPKVIDLSLGRVETLLSRLGNPERKLPPVIHVAGTNGKGSVIAYLRAMLEAAGYRVHVYTSPHLVRFNERIRLAGNLIEEGDLSALLEECEEANAEDPITFFEITTVAAFLAFSRTPADIVLLETGLGGRLDATNVLEKPCLTMITPISMDHQQFLGDTIKEIAGEKAGILKAGVPCILARQDRKVEKQMLELADKAGSPLSLEGRDWFVRKSGGGLVFEIEKTDGESDRKSRRELPLPGLVGPHQLRNSGMALAAVEALESFTITDGAAGLGLKSVEWPARLQPLKRGPFIDMLPDGWELWLDGGHNGAAAKTIAVQARAWRDKPLHLVFGMLNSKEPEVFLKHLEGKIESFRGVEIPGEENSLSAMEVTRAAESLRMPAKTSENVEAAIREISTNNSPGRILIAGSLYLAGTVLTDNG